MMRKIIAFIICFCLIFEQTGFAQVAPQLGVPAYLQNLVPVADKFRPIHLRSLSFDQSTNNYNLLLDKGDTAQPQNPQIEETAKKLLEYFKIGLTLPNSMFWVNLRPDAPADIIDPYVEQTDLGRVLLEADLQLKKDMARFTAPNTPEGRQYWDRLYKKAESLYGNGDMEIPTLTRPWIVPGEIIIGESGDSAYVYKATLKVMLEQDYLKDTTFYNFDDPRLKELNDYSSKVLRELIIPKLTREVNSSKRYAALRQVFYSLVLAQWFKRRFASTGSEITKKIDIKDLSGLTSKTSWSKDACYEAYRRSFTQGEYNQQETINSPYGQIIRSYFSGGLVLDAPQNAVSDLSLKTNTGSRDIVEVTINSDGGTAISAQGLSQIVKADGGDGKADIKHQRLMGLVNDLFIRHYQSTGVSEDIFLGNDWMRQLKIVMSSKHSYDSFSKAAITEFVAAVPKEIKFNNAINEIYSNLGIPEDDPNDILDSLAGDFLRLIGVSFPSDREGNIKAAQIKKGLRNLLEEGVFSGIKDLTHFEAKLGVYELQLNKFLDDSGIKAKYPERILPALARMGIWASRLGLIDIAEIQGIPNAPRDLTVGISTRALAGLGDITKIAMVVNGLFEEFDNRGVNLHIKVFVFAEDASKMQTIDKGLRDKLGNYALKNNTKGTLEIIFSGDSMKLTIGNPNLNDVDVFISLVRPVGEVLTLPREVKPGDRVPPFCITLGEYDSMVPPNGRKRSVSLREVKTGFSDDSVGFFVNPYIEDLYQKVKAAGRDELQSMRRALLEDIIVEIRLEIFKRAFLRGRPAPSQEELAQDMDLETARIRAGLDVYQEDLRSAGNSSRWGMFYMHAEGIKYLHALQLYREQRKSQDSVTIFTFFGDTNRANAQTDEWVMLKRKAQKEGLDFEFYDLSEDPSHFNDIDFAKPVVRVINLGMRSLEANIRIMAMSDLPVGATGDESLLAALTLRKPVFYEVMSWKKNLFEGFINRLDDHDAEAALRDFEIGHMSKAVTALFDPVAPVAGAFSRLGDLVAGMKLYPGLVSQMFNHIGLENFFSEIRERYPMDVSMEAAQESLTITSHSGLLKTMTMDNDLFYSSWKEVFKATDNNYGKVNVDINLKMPKIMILDEGIMPAFEFAQSIIKNIDAAGFSFFRRMMLAGAKFLRRIGLAEIGDAIIYQLGKKSEFDIAQVAIYYLQTKDLSFGGRMMLAGAKFLRGIGLSKIGDDIVFRILRTQKTKVEPLTKVNPFEDMVIDKATQKDGGVDVFNKAPQKDAGNEQEDAAANKGGIDLRALPIVSKSVRAYTATGGRDAPAVIDPQVADALDKEWLDLQKQMQSGPMPYGKIKEYAVCCKDKGAIQRVDTIFSCIADILRMEEEGAVATAPELKEILQTI
jgi:hypothetical protein